MALFSPLFNGASVPPEVALLTGEVPPDRGVDGSAWRTLATSGDVLVIGDDPAIRRVLTTVWPTLQKPRFWCDSTRLRPLLAGYTQGILIFQNVDALEVSEQRRLLEWCRGAHVRSRMIATASRRLLTLVDSGAFSRDLYDCLRSTQLLLT